MENIDFFSYFAFRAVERLMVVGAAILSIYYGYKLFGLTLASDGEMEASTNAFKIKMQKIAPGVFFALFGTGVLIYSLGHTLSINAPVAIKQGKENSREVVSSKDSIAVNYLGRTTAIEIEMDAIKNIGMVSNLINRYGLGANATQVEYNMVNSSLSALQSYRGVIIDANFGPGTFKAYKDIATLDAGTGNEFNKLSADEKAKYIKISDVMGYSK
jgi:hypothetical protein